MNAHAQWEKNNAAYLETLLQWLRLRLRELIPQQQKAGNDEDEQGWSWFKRGKMPERKQSSPRWLQLSAPEKDEVTRLSEELNELEQASPPPALLLLTQRLNLSPFEQQVLALCVAMEVDPQMPGLCALAQGDSAQPHPSFALAFNLFDEPDWSALSPQSPLRFWRLLEISQPGATPLTTASLKADERVVNFIKGMNYLDDRIAPLVAPLPVQPPEQTLPPSQRRVADNIVQYLQSDRDGLGVLPVLLLGNDGESKRLLAADACSTLGVNAYALQLSQLPDLGSELESLVRLWQRESRLLPLALYLDASEAKDSEKQMLRQLLQRLLLQNHSLVFIDDIERGGQSVNDAMAFEVSKPLPEEQAVLWRQALGDKVSDDLSLITEQYSFNQTEIRRIAHDLSIENGSGDESEPLDPPTHERLGQRLRQACRAATRAGLERLARRINTKATWDDIVLPEEQMTMLRQISRQVFNRKQVYARWGFREKMNRGLGISALFSGESGVGKTMGAEVIANACELDLYSIDLSAVISKYIGETEKNLRKLFNAAEDSGAILFFDEADALFGKRSEVKDSHDRYANTQIDYLLQRMEAYPGLAILATNMKSALDKAFTRRLRFIVDFPFPDTELRQEIWQRVFPRQTPVSEAVDYARLARLNISGGHIHNIAINAAFLAAEQNSEVTMPLILNAARSEFRKLERPTKETDFLWEEPLEAVT